MKNKIKQLRELLGLTQEQLGALVGVSRQAINAIETGKYEPSIWLAYDIATVFQIGIEEVFLFQESPRKSRAEKSRRELPPAPLPFQDSLSANILFGKEG